MLVRSATLAQLKAVLTYITLAAAALYAAILLDPYIAVIMAPFFALACARGKKPLTVWALAAIPALLLVLISVVKFTIAGVPLVTYDHLFLRQNVLMLAYNDWRIASGCVLGVVVVVVYFYVLLRGRFSLRENFNTHEKAGLSALSVVAVGCLVAAQMPTTNMVNWDKELNSPSVRAFVKSAHIPKPELHTLAEVRSNNAGYTGLKPPKGLLPDMFFILQETTMHPNVLDHPHQPEHLFAQDPNSKFQNTGRLHVHTFAGGTWRSEFSVATQMRPQEFGSDGLYVFHQLEGRIKRSIFTMLKALGYKTMVFYPVPGSFINGRGFYTSIGVDEFYDPVTLGISKGWDWKTPDAVFYKAALDKVAESKQPVIAMILTIAQHGPHNVDDPMSDYVTRFVDSDQAYGNLLSALKDRGRPTGVVAFGDHQPEFSARFLTDRSKWYYTNYDVRCVNFDCAQTPTSNRGDKPLDIVLLPAMAFEAFGFKLDDVSALQRVAFKKCEDNIEHCDDDARWAFNGIFQEFLN
jgi:phosphoglycerol transferase MdoB-like AlkP superfamily enzyme